MHLIKDLLPDVESYLGSDKREVHSVVFEAVIGNYSNSVKDILIMRRQLKHTLAMLRSGQDFKTEEWKISDFDFAL